MQFRSVLAIAIGFSTLAALPALAEKSILAGSTGLSINGTGRIELVTSQPIDYLNPLGGQRILNLRVAQPLLCVDIGGTASSSRVALRYFDPNGDSSGLLFGGITNYDYVTNGFSPSLFKVTAGPQLACCVMAPASNASCFQGTNGGVIFEGFFANGFEAGAGGSAPNLAVSINGPNTVAQGANFAYTVNVANIGSVAVSNVRVRDWFPKAAGGYPAPLSTGSWTCAASIGASCGVSGTFNGNIGVDGVSLNVGSNVSFAVNRTMNAGAANGSSFSVSAAAFAPSTPIPETVLGNNQSALTATVQQTSLSISDVALAEGNNGTTNFLFTVTRSNNTGAVSVVVNTTDGTALAGSDYTGISPQTINFTAGGATTALVNVAIAGDTSVEPDETFFVNLSSPSGAAISDAQGQGTIVNDDAASIAINDVTVTEGNAGTSNATFTVTLTNPVQGGFTVPISSANGTAIAGLDYTAITGGSSLGFTGTAGETRTISVPIIGDTIVEANETFQVLLGTPSVAGVTTSDAIGIGTITNNDTATIAINDVSIVEGNSGSSNAVFTVTLTGEVDGGFTVPVSSANQTASSGSDYTAILGGTVISFTGALNQTRTISVPIAGDTIVEANETFQVLLGAPSNANVSASDALGIGTIINDDTATIAINDVTVTEGDTGSVNATFTVTLTGVVQGGFTVPVSSLGVTATSGTDFTALAGGATLTFTGNNAETRSVSVAVIGDNIVEADETFQVNLGAASVTGVTATDGMGIGTITNNDTATIAIDAVTLNEGNSGTTNFTFTVTLTGAVQGGFTVPVGSANVTAVSGSDYTAIPGGTLLNFTGTGGQTRTVTVSVLGDTIVEANELFVVNIGAPSVVGVSVAKGLGTGVGTIVNDDTATIAISAPLIVEGNSGSSSAVFTVTLAGAVQGGFTVPVASADQTAQAGLDYTAIPGATTLSFTGTLNQTRTIAVAITGDTIVEADETFEVVLGTLSNASVTASVGTAIGSIPNDDTATLAINDVSLPEGNVGSSSAQFSVTLTGQVQGGFTVAVSSADGTATAPIDYTAIPGATNLTFAGTQGEIQTISVLVIGDTADEPNETFTVNLGTRSVVAVGASDASGLGTITNDDQPN